jgi:hypothetical protein
MVDALGRADKQTTAAAALRDLLEALDDQYVRRHLRFLCTLTWITIVCFVYSWLRKLLRHLFGHRRGREQISENTAYDEASPNLTWSASLSYIALSGSF